MLSWHPVAKKKKQPETKEMTVSVQDLAAQLAASNEYASSPSHQGLCLTSSDQEQGLGTTFSILVPVGVR